jgi:hypothetical protein
VAEVGAAGSLPIAIRLADAPEALAIARGILSRAYATAGYGDDHAVILGKHQAPFIAWVREEIVETLTLTAGSPEDCRSSGLSPKSSPSRAATAPTFAS